MYTAWHTLTVHTRVCARDRERRGEGEERKRDRLIRCLTKRDYRRTLVLFVRCILLLAFAVIALRVWQDVCVKIKSILNYFACASHAVKVPVTGPLIRFIARISAGVSFCSDVSRYRETIIMRGLF